MSDIPSIKSSDIVTTKVVTEERKAILDLARAKRGALSPVHAGQVKTEKALAWVYKWGWSTSKILEKVGGAQRSGLAARLVKNGFLRATKTEAGPAAGAPLAILTLTGDGQREITRLLQVKDDLLPQKLDPYRIDQSKIRHNMMAQESTIDALINGGIVDYTTESMMASKSKKNVKQHDVIWVRKSGNKTGVEIELSAKWDKKLDDFILSCINSVENKSVDDIIIATDSKAIQNRYEAAFEIGHKFGKWEKSKSGFWTKTGMQTVPEFMEEKVKCLLI